MNNRLRNYQGMATGLLISLLISGCVFSQFSSRTKLSSPSPWSRPTPPAAKTIQTRFAVVADSHNENDNLKKALESAKKLGAEYVVGLGDFTQVGTIKELRAAKEVFDAADLLYFVIPGDHDLWDSRNQNLDPTANFMDVFAVAIEPSQQTSYDFGYKGVVNVMIDNSDVSTGIREDQWIWLEQALNQNDFSSGTADIQLPRFLFLHQPLDHSFLDHLMGEHSDQVDQQRRRLLDLVSKHRVDEVIAGHVHLFSRFTQSATGVKMTSIGAVATARNPDEPSFGFITVFTDGTYEIEKIELEV